MRIEKGNLKTIPINSSLSMERERERERERETERQRELERESEFVCLFVWFLNVLVNY